MKAIVNFFISIVQFFFRSKRDCVRVSWCFPGQDYQSSQTFRISRCKYTALQKNPWSVLSLKGDLRNALKDGRPMAPYIEATLAKVKKGQIVETIPLIKTRVQVSQPQAAKKTTKKGK